MEKWSGVEWRVRVGGHERIDEREVDRIGEERRGEELSEADKREEKRSGAKRRGVEQSRAQQIRAV